jgi:multiple sugar transport system substrate-binding protein
MKAYRTLCAVGVVAGLLATAGCGSGSGSDAGGVVKLSLWTGFTGPDRPAYEALVRQFNDAHSNIRVSMDVQPWDSITQRLPGAWASGQGPDLATPNFDPGSIFSYIKTNSVLPIDVAVGEGDGRLNVEAFPSSVTKAFTVDGKLYAAPANMASVALYYNKAMFAAAGITAPPGTQEEFVADVRKLTNRSSSTNQYGISLADHQTIQMWPILQWMNGGDIVGADGCAKITETASVEALTTWADLVANEHVSPVGQSGSEADTLFSAKKAAMELNGPWAADGFRKAGIDLGIAPVPIGPGGPVTVVSSVPLMIGKSTQHKAQAVEFLGWWTSKTAQTSFSANSGFPPARTDVKVADPNVDVFASALPNARLYLAGLEQSTQIDSDVYTQLVGKITRGFPVQSAAADAATAINRVTGCEK